MRTLRPLTIDAMFVAFAVAPPAALATTGILKEGSRYALLGLALLLLLTLLVPLRVSRGKAVPRFCYSICRRVFGVLSWILVYVGLFFWSMALFLAIFPPTRVIDGERVALMPIAHAFGALVVAGLLGSRVCWSYFRRPEQVWNRVALANDSPFDG